MENMQYAEELVREFLVFRGFTNTLQVLDNELSTDIGQGFHVDKLLDLIFAIYIPRFQVDKLVGLLNFFKHCFSNLSENVLVDTLLKLEGYILRYYIVYAIQSGRKDMVLEFFGINGNELVQKGHDWTPWFAIPYLKNPSLDPQFRIYFSKEWYEGLLLSALLEEKEALICRLRSSAGNAPSTLGTSVGQANSITSSSGMDEENFILSVSDKEIDVPATLGLGERELNPERAVGEPAKNVSRPRNESSSISDIDIESGKSDVSHMNCDNSYKDDGCEMQGEEEFPEVKVDFQETFLGHTSAISRCRFSASGNNIASASVDGTVRIWTYDSSTSASRNATIYCGAEIMSLDWECKSDRLAPLMEESKHGMLMQREFVLDLKCSPVEPIFVSAAASRRHGSNYIESLGFASLTVWNMKTWRAMSALPLGEDPPAITSLSFNHNGKILAAAATDGMIHIFDMAAGLQITGWPAHDTAISSILFGPDETSIFSLGSDGKIFEWSLQNQGHILWSRNDARFCDPGTSKHCRHEMALDANGRKLLVTSGSVRAPIYQVRGYTNGLKTLPHSAAITTVDWHPTLPIFLTGSADNSVRVTSIL
ncbi:WD repeat-containing protein 91-like isoform X1 [Populus alba x Populus x berolinensis]|nr:WD repeat-containing protein 91-like isoform X1 [Populus alba x Populus x berolinensis]